MKDEKQLLNENCTFELVKLPKEKRALKNRRVYRVKKDRHSLCPRYKVRFVVKGFIKKKGDNFERYFLQL